MYVYMCIRRICVFSGVKYYLFFFACLNVSYFKINLMSYFLTIKICDIHCFTLLFIAVCKIS